MLASEHSDPLNGLIPQEQVMVQSVQSARRFVHDSVGGFGTAGLEGQNVRTGKLGQPRGVQESSGIGWDVELNVESQCRTLQDAQMTVQAFQSFGAKVGSQWVNHNGVSDATHTGRHQQERCRYTVQGQDQQSTGGVQSGFVAQLLRHGRPGIM